MITRLTVAWNYSTMCVESATLFIYEEIRLHQVQNAYSRVSYLARKRALFLSKCCCLNIYFKQ